MSNLRPTYWRAALLVLFLEGGCTAGSVRGTWYYEESGSGGEGLYLALINEGPKLVGVDGIVVNASGKPSDVDCGALSGLELDRGQLLVCKLPSRAFRCRIPVDARLQMSAKRPDIIVRLSGAMPTSLPEAWTNCCGSNGAGNCTAAPREP